MNNNYKSSWGSMAFAVKKAFMNMPYVLKSTVKNVYNANPQRPVNKSCNIRPMQPITIVTAMKMPKALAYKDTFCLISFVAFLNWKNDSNECVFANIQLKATAYTQNSKNGTIINKANIAHPSTIDIYEQRGGNWATLKMLTA